MWLNLYPLVHLLQLLLPHNLTMSVDKPLYHCYFALFYFYFSGYVLLVGYLPFEIFPLDTGQVIAPILKLIFVCLR